MNVRTEQSELIRQRLGLASSKAPLELPIADEVEVESDGRCFGFLRGVGDRALNLELKRSHEGDTVSFPYSWLGATRYHPSLGILLLFSASDTFGIRIRGRNLNKMLSNGMSLYDKGIMRHRITYIRDMRTNESSAAENDDCVVDQIEIAHVAADKVMQFLRLGN
jgi:hypothetical protein